MVLTTLIHGMHRPTILMWTTSQHGLLMCVHTCCMCLALFLFLLLVRTYSQWTNGLAQKKQVDLQEEAYYVVACISS
jgi:hypothetical protein